MPRFTYMLCCGLVEMHGVQHYRSPTDFNDFLVECMSTCKGGYIFSGAGRSEKPRTSGAIRFARDIVKHDMGVVTKLPPFKNPNTRNIIHTYLWAIDRQKATTYLKERGLGAFRVAGGYY